MTNDDDNVNFDPAKTELQICDVDKFQFYVFHL